MMRRMASSLTRRAARLWWPSWALIACARNPVGDGIGDGSEDGSTAHDSDTSHDADDDGVSSDGEPPGEAESGSAEGGGSEGDGTGATDDPWALCDATAIGEPPKDVMPCPGGVPEGQPDGTQAEWIFGRAVHEVGHIVAVVRDGKGDGGVFELDGDEIQAAIDVGYVVGHVARGDTSTRACVALSFACWTGGHGGFGPSALHGSAEVLIDGETVQARGQLGLTEGAALTGAPAAEVWMELDDASAQGTVGRFEF